VRIAEIFHSVQGEGSLLGTPSSFVRTSGCNLRCVWCDTPYASWKPEGPELSDEAILKEIEAHGARHVVLTGGEPMVATGIHSLAAAIHNSGRHLTIETAGTVAPGGIACDLASISPKLAHSSPGERLGEAWRRRHEERRWQPEVVRAWIETIPFQLKFVVCDQADLDEVESMIAQLGPTVGPENVFLMPEGVDLKTLRQRAAWLVGICLQRGYRFGHRLQIELFGHTRGT
jgi:7-carboxy-7-deazaguanine synthase